MKRERAPKKKERQDLPFSEEMEKENQIMERQVDRHLLNIKMFFRERF